MVPEEGSEADTSLATTVGVGGSRSSVPSARAWALVVLPMILPSPSRIVSLSLMEHGIF